jgi:hypothetical protein
MSEKKKIRGLRRKAKSVEVWRQASLRQGFDESASRDWHKLHINPWYSLARPRVPHGLKLQMLKALIEIYDSWKKRLDEGGEAYYLAIWLFPNHFIESQVVMGRREELERYENIFFAPKEKLRFDAQSFKPIQNLMGRFSWEQKVNCSVLEEDERANFSDDNEWYIHQRELEHARKHSFKVETQNGKKYFFLKESDVWVGRAN